MELSRRFVRHFVCVFTTEKCASSTMGNHCHLWSFKWLPCISTANYLAVVVDIAGLTTGLSTVRYRPRASCSHVCASVNKQYKLVAEKVTVWHHTGNAL